MSWNRLSYDEVRARFSERGCVLISKEYINNSIPLEFICSCGGIGRSSLGNFMKSPRCARCGEISRREKRKFDFSYVRQFYEDRGCVLLESEYSSIETPMRFLCICGNEDETTFGSFRSGRRCLQCGRKRTIESRKLSSDYVSAAFAARGYTVLDAYCNNRTPLTVRCPKGHLTRTLTFSNFMSGKGCYECSPTKYKPEKTDEERIRQRKYAEYEAWRATVYKKYWYTCQCCGYKGRDLIAHHILNYSNFPELRTDISNGVVLCRGCHHNFHQSYGYWNNNEVQLDEFIRKYKEAA